MNEHLIKIPRQTISGKTVYLVVTAAGKIEKIAEMADELIGQGCNVHLFPTEKALNIIEPLKKFSDNIHEDFNWHGPRRSIPEEDIVIVAPCTFNTFNKIALGIADNYPTTLVATAIGKKKRVLVIPAFNKDMWNHPQTMESLKKLESWGVIIIWPNITKEKVSMMDYRRALDRLYIEESKIIFDSEQMSDPQTLELLNNSRKKYYEVFRTLGETQEKDRTNFSTNGNYSIRVDDNWALITSTGSRLGNLALQDLTLINLKTKDKVAWCGEKMPSCDTPMHIVYYQTTGTNAIAHSHCGPMTYSDALEEYKTPEYVRYGSFDAIIPTVPHLQKNNGFMILRFHGELGIGNTLNDAYSKIKHYYQMILNNEKA